MKPFILFLAIAMMSTLKAQNGKASTVRTTFSRETTISIEIKADPAIVWALLTKASDYPRWNSTIVSIEGNIAPGEKIRLKSTLDAKRTFKLKVKESVAYVKVRVVEEMALLIQILSVLLLII